MILKVSGGRWASLITAGLDPVFYRVDCYHSVRGSLGLQLALTQCRGVAELHLLQLALTQCRGVAELPLLQLALTGSLVTAGLD